MNEDDQHYHDEVEYANLICSGQTTKMKQFLDDRRQEDFYLRPLKTDQLYEKGLIMNNEIYQMDEDDHEESGENQLEKRRLPSKSSPLDLAVETGHYDTLHYLLERGFGNYYCRADDLQTSCISYLRKLNCFLLDCGGSAFLDYLGSGDFVHLSDIIDASLEKGNFRAVSKILDSKIKDVSKKESDCKRTGFELDFSPFFKRSRHDAVESTSVMLMAENCRKSADVLNHPLTETFIALKWRMFWPIFYFWLFYKLLFAIFCTINFSDNSGPLKWICTGLAIPLLMKNVILIIVSPRKFHSLRRAFKTYLIKSVELALIIVLLLSIIIPAKTVAHIANAFHLSHRAIGPVFAWCYFMMDFRRSPNRLSVHFESFEASLGNFVCFFVAYSPICVALILTTVFHPEIISLGNDHSVIAVIVLIAVFLINAMIALSAVSSETIKDLKRREKITILSKTASMIHQIDLFIFFLKRFFRADFIYNKSKLFNEESTTKVLLSKKTSNGRRRLQATHGKATYGLPIGMLSRIHSILEEKKLMLSSLRIRRRPNNEVNNHHHQEDQECHYVCPNWEKNAPDNLAEDEPYYETVSPPSSFHLVRDSVLRELRKDLVHLIRGSENDAGDVDRDGEGADIKPRGAKAKSVNVRPGLALGVITLQAGTKGAPKVTLHQ